MDYEFYNTCKVGVAKADEEITALQKQITDVESKVVDVPAAQSWKYKKTAVPAKQREKDELIARLKQKMAAVQQSVSHMRSILEMHAEMLQMIAEMDALDQQVAKGSATYYLPCPVDFQNDFLSPARGNDFLAPI